MKYILIYINTVKTDHYRSRNWEEVVLKTKSATVLVSTITKWPCKTSKPIIIITWVKRLFLNLTKTWYSRKDRATLPPVYIVPRKFRPKIFMCTNASHLFLQSRRGPCGYLLVFWLYLYITPESFKMRHIWDHDKLTLGLTVLSSSIPKKIIIFRMCLLFMKLCLIHLNILKMALYTEYSSMW